MSGIETFFSLLFRGFRGYVCIAVKLSGGKMAERFFYYPDQLPDMAEASLILSEQGDVYFCPQLLKSKRRSKINVEFCPVAWADLDRASPQRARLTPTVALETSEGRYQAFWSFIQAQQPQEAEEISKAIAYGHVSEGADTSGWDLTQLLRVPETMNRKYDPPHPVRVLYANRNMYRSDHFDCYERKDTIQANTLPFPEDDLPSASGEEILSGLNGSLQEGTRTLFSDVPGEDWSTRLWNLELLCLLSGLSKEETFVVARDSACNKYARDGRSLYDLWKEVCKAATWARDDDQDSAAQPGSLDILEAGEDVPVRDGFVERYTAWASSVLDAPVQYHRSCAVSILATVLSPHIRVRFGHGVIKPNLWLMILGPSTMMRKSASMDKAIDFLEEVDPEAKMSGDSSPEGIFKEMSLHEGKSSLFHRER